MGYTKTFTLRVLFVLSFISLASSVLAFGQSVWIQNASDRAFNTSPVPASPTTTITLYAAKNEYQGAQILVRSTSAQTGVSVTANSLTGPGGATIPATNIKVTREITHNGVWEVPTDFEVPPGGSNPDGISGNYTDSLEDNTPQSIAANVTQPYYYSVYASPTQTPGTYTGTAVVNSSLGNVTVNVSVTVYNVTIPPTNQSTYRMNNWFGSVGWDYTGTPRVIPLAYGVTTYDNNWWTVITNIAKNHAKHRNNVIFADYQGFLTGASACDSSGNITPDWTNFDRFIQTFIDQGTLQYIYSPQQMQHVTENGVEVDQINMLVNDGTGHCTHTQVDAGTSTATTFLQKMFPLLKAHLDAKGWTSMFYMSAQDEPSNQAEITSALWFYNLYKAVFGANALTNEAHAQRWTGEDAGLSTYTPLTNVYDTNTAFYQHERVANGKDLWLYTSSSPQGDARMNRFISYHLDKTRLLPWQDWKVGAIGHLHWGWDYWVNYDNTLGWYAYDTEAGSNAGWGDAWLVRPNKSAYDIYDSVRSEAQLYGIQDYELLNILRQTKPLIAKSIAESLITNFSAYTRLGSLVENAHKEILDEIVSAQPDARFTFSDNFSSGNDGNWIHTLGSWSASGGAYSQTNAGQWQAASLIKGRSYGDFVLTFDVKITNNNGNNTNWAGAVIRSANGTDIDTGYLVALRDNGELFLYRTGDTLVASGPATAVPGYVSGQYTTIKVVAQGNNIQVFGGYSTTPLINYNDSGFSAGNIALITASAATFDNVVINAEQNYAEGKPASSLTTYTADGWSPQGGADGQKSSVPNSMGYSSNGNLSVQSHNEWFSVDFGKVYSLSRVDLYPRNDGANTGYGFPVDFTIQTSTDGTTWTTALTETNYPMPSNAVQSFPFPSVNARYVKVNATKLSIEGPGATTYRLQFADLQAFGGNLAAGKSVSASSSYESAGDGWTMANATDGATLSNVYYSMGWSSAISSGSEWVTVDLGGNSTFTTVNLFPRNDGANTGYGFPIDFTIQTSPDNTTWTTVVTRTGYPQPGNAVQTFTFPSTTARYVRINGTNLRTDGPGGALRMQFAEIQVE